MAASVYRVRDDVNGDGAPDLIGITTDGHLYAWDVRNQILIWSRSGLGGGTDVAVADLHGDGKQEIVALTGSQVLVFTQSAGGITQTASYSVSGTDLLVADTNGDGKAEIYVLSSNFGANATVYQLDGSLALLNSYPVASSSSAVPATSLYLEDSGFTRKNLIVAVGSTYPLSGIASMLEVIDPSSGSEIWESPPLRGVVPINSLNFYDLNGDGQREIAFGSSVGMYLTR